MLTDPDAVTVVGNRIVSVVTVPGNVEAGIVVAGIVDPGNVVVNVSVISTPSDEAGIADPTPEAVNWEGMGSVAVFGF